MPVPHGDEDEALLLPVVGERELSERAFDVDDCLRLDGEVGPGPAIGVDAREQLETVLALRVFGRGRNRLGAAPFALVGGDAQGLARPVGKRRAFKSTHSRRARGVAGATSDRQRQQHDRLCYRSGRTKRRKGTRAAVPLARRARGAILRLVRRRALALAVGLALAAPAAWVELAARDAPWWIEGLSLVAGATGLALIWTAVTGAAPDWVE